MSEVNQPDEIVPEGPIQPGPPSPDAPEPAGDELDELLRQYDEEVKPEAAPESSLVPEQPPADTRPLDERLEEAALLDHLHGHDARPEILGALNRLHEAEAAAAQRADRADLDVVVKWAANSIPEIGERGLPASFVEAWLVKEHASNERLQRDWANRHSNPEAAKVRIGKALTALRKELLSQPDRALSEDRELITQSMRGMSGGPPSRPPTNWSNLSDKDFADQVERQFGYRSFR